MKKDLQFSVIDEACIGSRVYSTPDFNLVIHEYLSIINDELKTLIKFNTRSFYHEKRIYQIYTKEHEGKGGTNGFN